MGLGRCITMTIDYRFECTACGHKWELYGDGLTDPANLSKLIMRCSCCGCQILIVTETHSPEIATKQIDFTEQNIALSEKNKIPDDEIAFYSKYRKLPENAKQALHVILDEMLHT